MDFFFLLYPVDDYPLSVYKAFSLHGGNTFMRDEEATVLKAHGICWEREMWRQSTAGQIGGF